jgi:hypothetical protein
MYIYIYIKTTDHLKALCIVQCIRKVTVHLGYGTLDLVVRIEVAVEVCCCFTVFSC